MELRSPFAILIFALSFLLTKAQYRVIGGRDWNIQRSPYIVSINNTRHYICTGALITMQRVVTAAHCLVGLREHDVTVAAGVSDLRDLYDKGQTRNVKHIRSAPDFNYQTMYMDIAVIILRIPFFECNTINTIQLCDTTLNPLTAMQVSGWGWTTPYNGAISSKLKSAVLYMLAKDECAARYATTRKVLAETIICTGGQGAGTCYGDSGAPGVVNERLCGVVSGGIKPYNCFYPTFYTSINNANVLAFLNSVQCN